MKPITENHIESIAIETLQSFGWEYIYGLAIAPGAEKQERENYEQIILTERLRKAVAVLNPHIPETAREQAVQKVLRIYSPDLLHNNETFHEYLVEKIKIPYQQEGYERSYEVALIDFENVLNNEFAVINQYTIVENGINKRPDVLLFINGIPLVIMELKNAADDNATIEKAFEQIRTYKATIPSLFTYNAICVISDGHKARAGTLSSDFSRYMVWKSADGIKDASRFRPQLETLLRGMMNPATLLDLIRNFIVFEKTKREDAKTGITQIVTEKKLAAYHQYYAVNKAVESSIRAAGDKGNKKGGVVWHTQGSGKSLSMVFYAGKLITSPEMQNPTIVIITDRNDLKELLKVASGGIVFTTIQKFLPDEGKAEYDRLSERKNIVVIADEAHRTQYGFEAVMKDVKDKGTKEVIGQRIAYGFAKYMRDALPNATYIGFTGTPIESTDVNTP